MKLTNFKMYTLMIAAFAVFAFSGCDGTTGIPSDSGISTEIPTTVPDAVESTVTANPVSIAADGTETATVTVTVKDENANLVTNATVTLEQTGSSTISAVTNRGDGTYMFTVTSTADETVTYTATADAVIITQTADVTFTETEEQCLLTEGYGTIVINGRTWLDKNLGASEVAADTDDTAAYGALYQWGRSAEGHQERTSDTNDTLATTLDGSDVNTAWYRTFIVSSIAPRDWVDTAIDDDGSIRSQSWSTPYDKTTNPNQVCPCGYIVPTEQDFIDLNITASNATDTFKLAYGGWRWYDSGVIEGETDITFFWTSAATSYFFRNNNESIGRDDRGYGLAIRCIKP